MATDSRSRSSFALDAALCEKIEGLAPEDLLIKEEDVDGTSPTTTSPTGLGTSTSSARAEDVEIEVIGKRVPKDGGGSVMRYATMKHRGVNTSLEDARDALQLQQLVYERDTTVMNNERDLYRLREEKRKWEITENILRGQLSSRGRAIEVLRETLWQDLMALRASLGYRDERAQLESGMPSPPGEFTYLDAFRLLEEEPDEDGGNLQEGTRRLLKVLQIEMENEKAWLKKAHDDKVANLMLQIRNLENAKRQAEDLADDAEVRLQDAVGEVQTVSEEQMKLLISESEHLVRTTKADCNRKLDEKEETITELQVRVKELEEEVAYVRSKLEETSVEHSDTLAKKLDEVTAKRDEVQALVRERDHEIMKLKGNVAQALREKREAVQDKTEYEGIIAEHRIKVRSLEGKLADAQENEEGRLAELITRYEEQIKELKSADSSKRESERIRRQGAGGRFGAQRAANDLLDDVQDSLKMEIASLEHEVNGLQDTCDDQRHEIDTLRERLDKQQAGNELLQREYDCLHANHEVLRTRIQSEVDALQRSRGKIRPSTYITTKITPDSMDEALWSLEQLERLVPPLTIGADDFSMAVRRALLEFGKRTEIGHLMICQSIDELTHVRTLPVPSDLRPLPEILEFENGKITDDEIQFAEAEEEKVQRHVEQQLLAHKAKMDLLIAERSQVPQEAEESFETLVEKETAEREQEEQAKADEEEAGGGGGGRKLTAGALANLVGGGGKSSGPSSKAARSVKSGRTNKTAASKRRTGGGGGGLRPSHFTESVHAQTAVTWCSDEYGPDVAADFNEEAKGDEAHPTFLKIAMPNFFFAEDEGEEQLQVGALAEGEGSLIELQKMEGSVRSPLAVTTSPLARSSTSTSGPRSPHWRSPNSLVEGSRRATFATPVETEEKATMTDDLPHEESEAGADEGVGEEQEELMTEQQLLEASGSDLSLSRTSSSLLRPRKGRPSTAGAAATRRQTAVSLLGGGGAGVGGGPMEENPFGEGLPDLFSEEGVALALDYAQRGVAFLCKQARETALEERKRRATIAAGGVPASPGGGASKASGAGALIHRWFGIPVNNSIHPFSEQWKTSDALSWLYRRGETVGPNAELLLDVMEMRIFALIEIIAEQRETMKKDVSVAAAAARSLSSSKTPTKGEHGLISARPSQRHTIGKMVQETRRQVESLQIVMAETPSKEERAELVTPAQLEEATEAKRRHTPTLLSTRLALRRSQMKNHLLPTTVVDLGVDELAELLALQEETGAPSPIPVLSRPGSAAATAIVSSPMQPRPNTADAARQRSTPPPYRSDSPQFASVNTTATRKEYELLSGGVSSSLLEPDFSSYVPPSPLAFDADETAIQQPEFGGRPLQSTVVAGPKPTVQRRPASAGVGGSSTGTDTSSAGPTSSSMLIHPSRRDARESICTDTGNTMLPQQPEEYQAVFLSTGDADASTSASSVAKKIFAGRHTRILTKAGAQPKHTTRRKGATNTLNTVFAKHQNQKQEQERGHPTGSQNGTPMTPPLKGTVATRQGRPPSAGELQRLKRQGKGVGTTRPGSASLIGLPNVSELASGPGVEDGDGRPTRTVASEDPSWSLLNRTSTQPRPSSALH